MDRVGAAFAKLFGIQRAVNEMLAENEEKAKGNVHMLRPFRPSEAEHYFKSASAILGLLRENLPDLYGDFHPLDDVPDVKMSPDRDGTPTPSQYSHRLIQQLGRDIGQLLELRANSELEQPKAPAMARQCCVFISHGNSEDWRKVQPYLERDLGLRSIELAQETNAGMTIIEKLFANADRCDSAVIVWTGDDKDDKGTPRARENVMHEIGFFQGKYGRGRVILLHEEGVNVPTNLAGVVYSPFPKGGIEASFHLLARELKHVYG